MKKQIISLMLFSFAISFFMSCDKEVVDSRYKADFGEVEPWEIGQEVVLLPGINDAVLKSDMKKRTFRYFMPSDLPESGVGIVFRFHGNLSYFPGDPYNPVGGFNEYHKICKIAEEEKFIVVCPVSSIIEDLQVYGWNDAESNARFFDKMIEYFKAGCPGFDDKQIYVTGVSSGAIFSYSLAYLRSEVIAASVPVSGQYSFGADFVKPNTAVPIRTYCGTADIAVDWQSAWANHQSWAVNVANCNPEDKTEESIVISNGWYGDYNVDVTKWPGGDANMEFYAILGGDHSLNNEAIDPSIWEFMKANKKK